MAPGFKKQCFCEKKVPKKPTFCATEGDTCSCPAGKTVFYGAKASKKNT